MTTHHRITTSAAVALALAAAAAPAAATPVDLNANGSYVPAAVGSSSAPSHVSQPAPASTPTIVRMSSGNGGFDWGDAGIGAAGGFALSMLGLGSVLAVSQRRTRRSEALTS